jgi:hypothetical protein
MAIGSVVGRSRAFVWNGRSWRLLHARALFGMQAVSCTGRGFCIAVGTNGGRDGNVSARWNGRTWRSLPTPDTGCFPTCGLAKVSCVSPKSCMAVGSTMNNAGNEGNAAAIIWNGRSWRVDNAPKPTALDAALSGVSCRAGLKCTAVGSFDADTQPCPCTLIDTFDGHTWQIAKPPTVSGALSAVSCARAGQCVAVGGTLAEAGGGGTWKQLTIATPGETATELRDVSCWRPSACIAVGDYTLGTGAQLTLAERWDGRSWRVLRTPTPGDPFNGLASVACPLASSCMAVGARINGSDAQVALADHWNGRRWRALTVPSPGAKVTVLNAVSCGAPDSCMAIGFFDAAGDRPILAEHWNGRSWRITSIKHVGQLTGISCLRSGICMAVGSSAVPFGSGHPIAALWNGKTWQVMAAAGPPGSQNAELLAVSCTSDTSCIAVGQGPPRPSSPDYPTAATWNGRNWRFLPVHAGIRGVLDGISCRDAQHCMAVGVTSSGPEVSGSLAESWNGTAWQQLVTPSPFPGAVTNLDAISCTGPASCMATGRYADKSGRALAPAESWNGSTLRLLPAANPNQFFNVLYGVGCMRGFRCLAVGEQDIQRTLAEKWTGARWLTLPTPNP